MTLHYERWTHVLQMPVEIPHIQIFSKLCPMDHTRLLVWLLFAYKDHNLLLLEHVWHSRSLDLVFGIVKVLL